MFERLYHEHRRKSKQNIVIKFTLWEFAVYTDANQKLVSFTERAADFYTDDLLGGRNRERQNFIVERGAIEYPSIIKWKTHCEEITNLHIYFIRVLSMLNSNEELCESRLITAFWPRTNHSPFTTEPPLFSCGIVKMLFFIKGQIEYVRMNIYISSCPIRFPLFVQLQYLRLFPKSIKGKQCFYKIQIQRTGLLQMRFRTHWTKEWNISK